jgi:rod shape-determining protein MreC
MESFLNRYRSITVLLLVIFAQLVLLAVQVKNDQDVRIIRIWTVTVLTPVARLIEGFRGGGLGFFRNYVLLHDMNAENRRLQQEVGRLKMENIFLKNQLSTADRAKALQVFQEHTPSKTVAATVILASAGANANVRFLDRGSFSGVQRGMAVVTPDGIVGKIIAAYPSASEMMLVTDSDFAAGVISQSGVRGTLKGQGNPTICKVDYVLPQEKIQAGEMLYTSGDDRIFPRGFTVGVVKEVRDSQPYKEIYVEPAGIQHGAEDVLILLEGVHQEIPKTPPTNQPVYIAPPVPGSGNSAQPAESQPAAPVAPGTAADRLRLEYKAVGEEQNHNYGEGGPGSKPPDFTKLPPEGQPGATTPSSAPKPAVNPPANPAANPPANPQGNPAPAGKGVTPPVQTAKPPVPATPPGRGGAAAAPVPAPPPARRANQANGPGGLPLE